jgi:hypothetical protein
VCGVFFLGLGAGGGPHRLGLESGSQERAGHTDKPTTLSPNGKRAIELARVIRSEWPLVKTILVSGHEMPLDGVHHDAFFAKPYNAPTIILRIKALLN